MDFLSVFEDKFQDMIKMGVRSIILENNEENVEVVNSPEKLWGSQNTNMSCSYCKADFPDVTTQREHYKLDWHRFNLKQSLSGRNPISEQEFDVKNGNDDISSISGSDSEKEDTLESFATAQGKVFLRNEQGRIFSLYKCLLFKKKDELDDNILVQRLRSTCVLNRQWSIFMLGGGHFAGAIFKNGDPILHKTFHCYTVRQGQGGSQSSRDNKSGGSHPKSAGASLRRYNEQALIQHIQDILEQWKTEISTSSLIFYRATGPYNRSVLFSGQNPILERSDERLRTIPFSTRRATYAEVQRVFGVLSKLQIFENLDSVTKHIDKQRLLIRDTKRSKIRSSQINRAKSREIIERPLPTKHSSETNLANRESNDEEENDNGELTPSDQEISLEHLEEYKSTEKPKGRSSKKKRPKKSKMQKLQEQENEKRNEIIKVLVMGNLIKLKELVTNIGNSSEAKEMDVKELRNNFMNTVLDDDGNCLIHIAAMNEHSEVIKYLLENNSDPCSRNKKLQTAYCCTNSKEVRDVMKEFARENPNKYNYNKAQIPLLTLSHEEVAEKKKIQKKIKREKEKTKREEQKIKNKEDAEKERFLKLTDREKRALAAERRILSQNGTVISRCFLCGTDISGKVPFEYLGNRFCSMDCLKAHRIQNPTTLS